MRLEKAMMGQCRAECRGSRNNELTEGAARERKKAQNNRAERGWEEPWWEEERAAAPCISPALDPITSHRYASSFSPGEPWP